MSEQDIQHLRDDIKGLRGAIHETNENVAGVNVSVKCLETQLSAHIKSNEERLIRGEQQFVEMTAFVRDATKDKINHSDRLYHLEGAVINEAHPENGLEGRVVKLEKQTLITQTIAAVKLVGGVSGIISLTVLAFKKYFSME